MTLSFAKDIALAKYAKTDFIVLNEGDGVSTLQQFSEEKVFTVCFVKNDKGDITGFVSSAKLLQHCLAPGFLKGIGFGKKKMSSVMSPISFSLKSDVTFIDIVDVLPNLREAVVPVLQDRKLVGYLTFDAVWSIFGDISEAMEKIEKDYKQQLENRDDFIGIVSHDLRSPLSVIMVCCDYLGSFAEGSNKLNDLQKDFITRVKRNGEKALSLISDLLDISRLKAGGTLEIEEVDLGDYLESLASNLQFIANTKDITISYVPAEKVLAKLDQKRFRQIIDNLVGNAIKFSPRGKMIYLSYKFQDAEGRPEVAISVRDEGPGFPIEMKDRLFQRYQQGDEKAIKEMGVGLGLSIARQFTTAHGGRISVASEQGRGTTFTVAMPNARMGAQEKAKEEICVLIVEDDYDIADFLEKLLSEHGMRAIAADNGDRALQLFREHRPHLVLSDLKIPHTDGFELLQQIKNLDPKIPYILMSGFYEDISQRQSRSVFKVDKFLAKPFEAETVLKTIRECLKTAGLS